MGTHKYANGGKYMVDNCFEYFGNVRTTTNNKRKTLSMVSCYKKQTNLQDTAESLWVYYKAKVLQTNRVCTYVMKGNDIYRKAYYLSDKENGMETMKVSEEKVLPDQKIDVLVIDTEDKNIPVNCPYADMIFSMEVVEGMLIMNYNYNTEIFNKHGIKIIHARVENILQSYDTKNHVGENHFLGKKEIQELKMIETEEYIDAQKHIMQLFEESVGRNKEKIAVIYEENEITYLELNKKVNSLCWYLKKNGVKEKDLVGICTERNLEMIIGIFAILKCGAAYIPIAPNHPAKRNEYIIQDSQIDILLVGSKTKSTYLHEKLKCIRISDDLLNIYNETEKLKSKFDSTSIVYGIYTSGTTGKPKGTLIKNDSLVNLLCNMKEKFCGLNEVILQKMAYTFDFSIWELFLWFICDAQLVLLPPAYEKEPEEIVKVIQKNGVTLTSFVPSALEIALPYFAKYKPKSLKMIFTSGEALPFTIAARFNNIFQGEATITNSYGPTEATVFTSFYNVPQNSKEITIGTPMKNTYMLILNESKLCGYGMIGEICIGGCGVSKGYLNQEKLTEEKFITNPDNENEILYRTGDMGYRKANGEFFYIGRQDDQIKLHGYRVELEEIRSVLMEHPDVQNAAISIKEVNGDKVLCSYIKSNKRRIDMGSIKSHMQENLPYYMVPQFFVQLEELPVNQNGKLDRHALPTPDFSSMEIVGARTIVEEKLLAIFKTVLKNDCIGITDSFDTYGGNSLKVAMLKYSIEKEMGIKIPFGELVDITVEELALKIENYPKYTLNSIPKTCEKTSEMSSAQKRIYITELAQPGLTYNIPYVIKICGKFDFIRLSNAFNKLIERHEILRTRFYNTEEGYYQQVLENYNFSIDHIKSQEDKLSFIINDFIKPFDFERDELLIRAKVVETQEASYLILDIHHIIFDGVSASILFNDISRLYAGDELEELSIQYIDFSKWQSEIISDIDEDYWINEFKGGVPVLSLKTDYVAAKNDKRGDLFESYLDNEILVKLKHIAKELDTTDYVVLLSAFSIFIKNFTNQKEFIIGSPIAGRIHPDTYDLIGMFVNTLPLKITVKEKETFYTLINRIKNLCYESYEHQNISFDKIVESVSKEISGNISINVVLAQQNMEIPKLILEGNLCDIQEINTNIPKFDLILSTIEQQDSYKLVWEYNAAIFSENTIKNFNMYFKNILGEILIYPDKFYSDLELGNIDSRIMEFARNAKEDYPEYTDSYIKMFENQVEINGEKIALNNGTSCVTYRQLNEKANFVAKQLRDYGIKKGDIVAVIADKSFETIISIYGILKVGAIYLPISQDLPEERKNFLIDDSKAKCVLCTENNRLSVDIKADYLIVDIKKEYVGLESENVNDDDAIYIIYTSGTSGMPKGVIINNKGIINFVKWQCKQGGFNEKSIVLQKSVFSFDASIWEIFVCHASGGELFMLNEEASTDIKLQLSIIKNAQITHALIIPSMFRVMLDYMENELSDAFESLQYIYLGAEELTPELVKKYCDVTKKTVDTLINLYGPTEITICATYFSIQDIENSIIPIGKPIANTTAYVMRGEKLCGIGMPGELCIGGDGVAKGYLNKPELTKERFIENPYVPGERIYRTGDLVRWLPDGNLSIWAESMNR